VFFWQIANGGGPFLGVKRWVFYNHAEILVKYMIE
jgi:hypothetical protein